MLRQDADDEGSDDGDEAEDEEDADNDEEDGDGLSSRYKEALAGAGGPSNNDDHSFTRYLRASQMNM